MKSASVTKASLLSKPNMRLRSHGSTTHAQDTREDKMMPAKVVDMKEEDVDEEMGDTDSFNEELANADGEQFSDMTQFGYAQNPYTAEELASDFDLTTDEDLVRAAYEEVKADCRKVEEALESSEAKNGLLQAKNRLLTRELRKVNSDLSDVKRMMVAAGKKLTKIGMGQE
ncbi:hypothetical protein DXG01_003519 [Tephrocybe rancida]|nr:hypothetical protein DXG01_003519 [Tephrocybe rancida]